MWKSAVLKWIVAVFVSVATLSATPVELRVCTYNVGADFEQNFGLGAPGAPDYDAVRDVLLRLNADVVCLQEIHVRDTRSQNGATPAIELLQADLGLSHLYVPSSEIDSSLRVVILSRYPFSASGEIEAPAGANDLTRAHPVVTVDVPDTDFDPTLIGIHGKAGFAEDDRFRRAVDIFRIEKYLATSGLSAADNVILLGDFNTIDSLSDQTFTALPPQNVSGESDPDKLPVSYDLGDDFSFPITYFREPDDYFSFITFDIIDARSPSGSDNTQGSSRLDYILISPALSMRPFAAEVYRTTQDTNSSGLPKSGSPLPSGTGSDASDHFPVVADITLESDLPNLIFTASAGPYLEGTFTADALTISLPSAAEQDITATISISAPDEIAGDGTTLTFQPGETQKTFNLQALRDGIDDGAQLVTITATAIGYDDAETSVMIADIDQPFIALGNTGAQVRFDDFTGGADPAGFNTDRLDWISVDASDLTPGWQHQLLSSPANRLLGIRLDESSTPAIATATVRNTTNRTLTDLKIGFNASNFELSLPTSADTINVDFIAPDGTISSLPDLDFDSGEFQFDTLATSISGQNILPNDEFQLRFTFTPGPSDISANDDIFLNEIHYDNSSSDVDEFVEIIVGAARNIAPSDVILTFYNGSNAQAYRTLTLADAISVTQIPDPSVAPALVSIYHVPVAGLQNGDSDGVAISLADGTVIQTISYEGPLTAADGPAAGITFTELPVSQSPAQPAGEGSLYLTGSGLRSSDFAWTRTTEANTPGALNPAQTLTSPISRALLSIDNLIVTSDGDADGDGFRDFDEIAIFGTDPDDANSRYQTSISADATTLSYTAISGYQHQLQTSADLVTWIDVGEPRSHLNSTTTFDPNGSIIARSFPVSIILPEAFDTAFYRIKLKQSSFPALQPN